MKKLPLMLLAFFLLSTIASLSAKDIIIYGATSKVGALEAKNLAGEVASGLKNLTGDFGGTFGVRISTGRIIGFEKNISLSPKFALPGVYAFQMDDNLIIQLPAKKFAPYVTAGIGFVKTWGKDMPTNLDDPAKIAKSIYNVGASFSTNYGGGIKVRKLKGPFGANLDIRGYNMTSGRYVRKNLNFIRISVGLLFSF
jgi:hypothetical protein